jgi:hypothetical protein
MENVERESDARRGIRGSRYQRFEIAWIIAARSSARRCSTSRSVCVSSTAAAIALAPMTSGSAKDTARALGRHAPQFEHLGAELITNFRQEGHRVRHHGCLLVAVRLMLGL